MAAAAEPELDAVRARMDDDLRALLGDGEVQLFTRARTLFAAALASGDERMWSHFYAAVRTIVKRAERGLAAFAAPGADSARRRLRAFLEENTDLEGVGPLRA